MTPLCDRPVRIWRRRARGWLMPPNTVCVTRPGRFGNRFKVERGSFGTWSVRTSSGIWGTFDGEADARGTAVMLYAHEFTIDQWRELVRELQGRNLACWCRPSPPGVRAVCWCHGDWLVEAVNAPGAADRLPR